MKGFFNLFRSSFNELKDIRTLTSAGMLMALSIALRSVAIEITPDIRISFSFIAIMAIAILFGPVVSGIANISSDFLGYILANHSAREYSIPLALVTLLAGVVYGIICYRATEDETEKYSITPVRISVINLSRAAVVFLCNICLNSLIIYTSYVNKEFSLFNPEMYDAFKIWITPRIIKNAGQLVVDIIIISIIIPIIINVYSSVKNTYSTKKRKKSST